MCKLVDLEVKGETVKVADVKVHHIRNIIEQAKKCSSIDTVVLFGSSLEERCNEKSDIDMAIISKYTVYKLCSIKSFHKAMDAIYDFDMEQEYDKLYFKSLESIEKEKDRISICKELSEKGKIIYRKEN